MKWYDLHKTLEVISIFLISICHGHADVYKDIEGMETNLKTSILNLGDRADTLFGIYNCCASKFLAIFVEFSTPTQLENFLHLHVINDDYNVTLNNKDTVSLNPPRAKIIISVWGWQQWSFFKDEIIQFGKILEKYSFKIGKLPVDGISVKLSVSFCSHPGRDTTIYQYQEKMADLSKILRNNSNHGNQKTLIFGFQPVTFAPQTTDADDCYSTDHIHGSKLLAMFDFIIVSVKISASHHMYEYKVLQDFIKTKSETVISNIRRLNNIIDIYIDTILTFDSNPNFNNQTAEWVTRMKTNIDYQITYSNMISTYLLRYEKLFHRALIFSPIQLSKFENQNLPTNLSQSAFPTVNVTKFCCDILHLNDFVFSRDWPNSEHELFSMLSVIAKRFRVIVVDIEPPKIRNDPFSEAIPSKIPIENVTETVVALIKEFNTKFHGDQLSVIFQYKYDYEYNGTQEFMSLVNTISKVNARFPGLVTGLILTSYFGDCGPLSPFYQETQTPDLPNFKGVNEIVAAANVPLLAVGCYDTRTISQNLTKFLAEPQKHAKRISIIVPAVSYSSDKLSEFLDDGEKLVTLRNEGKIHEIWLNVEMRSNDIYNDNNGCEGFKEFYSMVRNWANANEVKIIVNFALDDGCFWSWGWFKGLVDEQSDFTDMFLFIEKIEDTCVHLEIGTVASRIDFDNKMTGVSFNLREKFINASSQELAVLLQIMLHKFKRIELTVDKLEIVNKVMKIADKISQSTGFSTFVVTLNISSSSNGDVIKQIDSLFHTLPFPLENLESKATKLSAIYFIGNNSNPNCSTMSIPSLKSMNKSKVKFGYMLNFKGSAKLSDCDNQFLKEFPDTVLINFLTIESINSTLACSGGRFETNLFKAMNKDQRIYIHELFYRLRGYILNIQKLTPRIQIVLKFHYPAIPLVDNKSRQTVAIQNFLNFHKFVNDFCTAFHFPYVIEGAFDNEHITRFSGDLKRMGTTGWWRITNNSDLTNLSVFVERESEYLNLETPRPTNIVQVNIDTDNLPQSSDTQLVVIMSFGSLFVVLFGIVVMLTILLQRKSKILSKQEVKDFLHGMEMSEGQTANTIVCDSLIKTFPYNPQLEIGKGEFNTGFGVVVGTGNFGIVYKTFMQRFGTTVAVKVPHSGGKFDVNYFKSLLYEIKVMSLLGEHVNVLKLLGAYTRDMRRGIVQVITEYCENGSLLFYLRTLAENLKTDMSISIYDLHRFSMEIAVGMEFIGSKNVVHMDLSARNVLLDGCKTCKISDFGLSRKLERCEKYFKEGDEPLPWKWMALESLQRMEFSVKSDVWSYGVTVWEIFSLGEIPYASKSWDEDFVKELETGLRLSKPKLGTLAMYNELAKCWESDQDVRPDFNDLALHFQRWRGAEYSHFSKSPCS